MPVVKAMLLIADTSTYLSAPKSAVNSSKLIMLVVLLNGGIARAEGSLCVLVGGDNRRERVLGVLLNEGNQGLERAVTLVVDEFFRASRLELDGGETGDAEGNGRRKVVLLGFHFGNDELVLHLGVLVSKLVPGGLETLAVTTPGLMS